MNKSFVISIAAAAAVALSSYATPGYGVGEPELIVAAPNSLTVSAEVTDWATILMILESWRMGLTSIQI